MSRRFPERTLVGRTIVRVELLSGGPMYYLISEEHKHALQRLAKRLYTEDRMNGDEMRNAAQLLDAIVASGIAVRDSQINVEGD